MGTSKGHGEEMACNLGRLTCVVPQKPVNKFVPRRRGVDNSVKCCQEDQGGQVGTEM